MGSVHKGSKELVVYYRREYIYQSCRNTCSLPQYPATVEDTRARQAHPIVRQLDLMVHNLR